MIDECEGYPGFLYQVHERTAPKVAALKNRLTDDVWPWNRRAFERACMAYIKSTSEECEPVVTPSPIHGKRSSEDQAREMENWHKPGKLLRSRLEAILSCLS